MGIHTFEIQGNPLSCEFPIGMCKWKYLRQLRARDCLLRGEIPEKMAACCANLCWVALNINEQLDPSSIVRLVSRLKNLEYADMADIPISGEQRKLCESKAPIGCRFQWSFGDYFQKYDNGWRRINE